MQALLEKLEGINERCGFILADGSIVEIDNVAPEPEHSFIARGEDILKYIDRVSATWHTHPGSSSNLSQGDAETFLFWPQCLHHIVGTDGVSTYRVENHVVLRA
jgi:proteasome lid subunit RPN8/RPN11